MSFQFKCLATLYYLEKYNLINRERIFILACLAVFKKIFVEKNQGISCFINPCNVVGPKAIGRKVFRSRSYLFFKLLCFSFEFIDLRFCYLCPLLDIVQLILLLLILGKVLISLSLLSKWKTQKVRMLLFHRHILSSEMRDLQMEGT